MCLGVDDVPARHPRVLMREDVAVVEPATGVVLDETGRDGFVRPHRRVVGERPRWIRPAVAVDVEGVEVRVPADGVDLAVLAGARGRRRGGGACAGSGSGGAARSPRWGWGGRGAGGWGGRGAATRPRRGAGAR